MKRILLFAVVFVFFVSNVAFSQSQKRVLDHGVYDKWQSIASEAISKDGRWVVYVVNPQEGDGFLTVTDRLSGKSKEIARGAEPVLSGNGQFCIFRIKARYADVRMAKIKKKLKDIAKDTLAVLDNYSGRLKKYAGLSSFDLPSTQSEYIAFKLFNASKNEKTSAESKQGAGKNANAINGELVLLNMKSGVERKFEKVDAYALDKYGKTLVFARNRATNLPADSVGVFTCTPRKESKPQSIAVVKGQYYQLTVSTDGSKIAFISSDSTQKNSSPEKSAYCYSAGKAVLLADQHAGGLKKDWEISVNGKLSFSEDGNRLFLGTSPRLTPRDSAIVDIDMAKLDIWNYQDDYLQPFQLRNREKELKRSYLAVIDLRYPGKLVQLATEQFPLVDLPVKGNALYGLAVTNYGHRIQTQWDGSGKKSIYTVSLTDGSTQLITDQAQDKSYLSPWGKYVVWFNEPDSAWYVYDVIKKSKRSLTHKLPVAFYDELNDVPAFPSPYGLSAFGNNDKFVLIYDKYDIWKLDLEKDRAENITLGYGRAAETTFKYYDLKSNWEERKKDEVAVVNEGQTLLLDAFNNNTKMEGWYKLPLTSGSKPRKLVMGAFSYSRPFMSADGKYIIYRKENYLAAPDLYVSKSFEAEKKLSAINVFQNEYNWGTDELVHWKTPAGYKGTGILYKPEDFDPSKKYPMIVYFYEKLSDKLNQYIPPAPTPSRLNISYFVSNGYLVFTPDISYQTGYPGKSAEEFINSGVESLKKFPWVDGSKIGIQGQSWGGYQVAHLITRTNMYAAAWAGAPVVDMFSAYGGIRWESGMSRQFQYEKTQSRIGATIWEKPELYVENSPLFHLPKVQTPVVIMANDADGAVPWYQGIEMFTALRRLNKPVWLLNYNNEAHNLVERVNRKDIQKREQQFFDHYLKGAPKPVWLQKGVPATEKGRNWGFDLIK